MISIEKMREINPELLSLSDAELEEARASLYELAEQAFAIWLKNKGSKYPSWSFPDDQEGTIV